MTASKPSRRSSARRGSAIIEFAIGTPVVIALLAGLFQFGYAFHVYHGLSSAIRNGARYASVADYDSPSGNAFRQAVVNVTVYGETAPKNDAKPLMPGLAPAHVAVTAETDPTGMPMRVSVTINGFSLPLLWQTFQINGKPSATFTYQGQYR